MTEHCEYGAKVDDMLRDRTVCGLHDNALQRRLLVETTQTLSKELHMARAAVATESQVPEIRASVSSPGAAADSETYRVNTDAA